MEIKFVSEDAYTQLIKKLDEIKEGLQTKDAKSPLKDVWIDIQEVCAILKLSKRTLQKYRNNNVLPFSQISGKIYFKAADIQKHLENNYIKSKAKR